MITVTGMSDLPTLTRDDVETLCDDHLRERAAAYRADQQSVAVVTAYLLRNSIDDEARLHATEVHRLEQTMGLLAEERAIRTTTERALDALRAELTKGGA